MSQKFPSSIQPTNFDLIVIGSGLEETILACAASLGGKTVLIVDHNPFFGGHFASLPLQDFTDFLHTHSKSCPQPELKPGSSSGEFNVLPLTTRPMYSSVEISVYSPEIIDNYGLFSVDLAGHRVLFCADPMMELILKTDRVLNVDIDEFIRFNCLEWMRASYVGLMKMAGHFGHGNDEEDRKIPEENLESPFSELKSIILHAIAMADYDQDNVEDCKYILKTKDGIDRLMLCHSSVARGQGMSVVVGDYKGVKLDCGQELFSHQLILAPSFNLPSGLAAPPTHFQRNGNHDSRPQDAKDKVVRGVCITASSLKPDIANCLLLYPPQALFPERLTSIRVLHLSSDMNVCPSGMFVDYVSTICEDAAQGKELLTTTINDLFSVPVSGNSEEDSEDHQSANTVVKVKPTLHWSTVYIQEQTVGVFDGVISASMPDGNLQHNNFVDASEKLFQSMYPDEGFFQRKPHRMRS
nr:rab escort protein 1-like [Coffea arabica]